MSHHPSKLTVPFLEALIRMKGETPDTGKKANQVDQLTKLLAAEQ